MTAVAYAEGRVAVDDEHLAIERGKRPAIVIAKQDIREVSVDEAKAFRHPTLGFLFALGFLLPSTWLLVTGWMGAGLFAAPRVGEAALFGTAFGAWILYEVLTSPRICWLRIRTPRGVERIALPGADRGRIEELIGGLRAGT